MHIRFIVLACVVSAVFGCKNKDGAGGASDGDTAMESVGYCAMPTADIGWYCIEYKGGDWSEASAEQDCADAYPNSAFSLDVCAEGAVGSCAVDAGTAQALVLHMYAMDAAVAELACEELEGGRFSDD